MQEIINLERQGWDALSSEGEAAVDFYDSILLEDAVMLFPGGMRVEGKAAILESFGSQPWKSYEIIEPKVAELADTVSVLSYRVTAEREGSESYSALISSTYILCDGEWKLGHHQQTLA